MKELGDWLAHCERLHPKTIDLGLQRVQQVALRMQLRFEAPVVTVAGTNGKGSTCAMLEAIALQAGWRTGVYTSPHLVRFEERCRIGGEIVQPDALVPHFERVEAARQGVTLTYFEFTTLAILSLMAASNLDVAILEVGLGGRLDAVNVIDTDCAIITSIDLDHMEFLGPDRESIGREKAGILRGGKPAIVSDPMPPHSVVQYAEAVGADLWLLGRDFNFSGDKQQWAWAGRGRRYPGLAYPALRGANQLLNASGVLAALEALRPRLPVTAQAIRNGLAMVELPGRFQIVPGQPTLVLDVAHNPHSVAALTANLDAMGFYPTTHAVFGAMADKDLAPMLARIGPLVDRWYFTDLPTARAASARDLLQRWQALPGRRDVPASTHASPQEALAAAVAAAEPTDRILVFGSFYTVGGVLEHGIPRLAAQHLVDPPSMALFKSRKKKVDEPVAAASPAESIEVMRRRARHRLIGAVVLVLVGVIGFPLLFDTQPRPVAVDIPIEIPDRNKVNPLPPLPAAPVASGKVAQAPVPTASVAAPAPAPVAESKPEPAEKVAKAEVPEKKPEPKAEPKPDARTETRVADAAKARALLEGKSVNTSESATGARYVVQVGAFAEKDKARQAQQKLERAGLKNYTNVAETRNGTRIRVRAGPFASRAEADRAAEKIKGLDLPAAILTL